MKLAEALQERADLNRTVEHLKERLVSNALVQEGEVPNENPEELKQALDAAIARLALVTAQINKTNCTATVDDVPPDGTRMTLTEIIAEKDALIMKIQAYQGLARAGSLSTQRARNTEIKIKPTFSVPALQTEIDRMSKTLRLLDNRLQACNWNTDLCED